MAPSLVRPEPGGAVTESRKGEVSSADNALTLVVALRERGRLRVADAARLLGVTPPTAHRLLSTLKRHEFAEQDRSRAYLPGPRLREAPVESIRLPDLSIVGHPYLVDLTASCGETTHLVTLAGNGCRFIDGVNSASALRVGSRVGLLLPAHVTSGGKVLLAQLTDAELTALYPDRRVRLRDGSLRELTSLRKELSAVRRQGYALNLEASEQGVNAVGVPVQSDAGRTLAALVVATPASRSTRKQLVDLVPVLQRTAREMARRTRASRPAGS